MARKHEQFRPQHENAPERVIKKRCSLARLFGTGMEIGPSHAAQKECVACEKRMAVQQIARALHGVPGRSHCREPRRAKRQLLAVAHSSKRKPYAVLRGQKNCCASYLSERTRPREMIGMNMGVNYVPDDRAAACSEPQVYLRGKRSVDYHCLTTRADEIGKAPFPSSPDLENNRIIGDRDFRRIPGQAPGFHAA